MQDISPAPEKHERIAVAIIAVIAAVLRLVSIDDVAVEHFDEGVYASSIWFGADMKFGFPQRHLYAPDFVPGAIQWCIILFGYRVGPLIPALVAGVLTPLLVWMTARRWFGVSAGLVAASLAATSDLAIIYSRSAMTDGVVLAWILLALYAMTRAVGDLSWRWSLVAGVAIGGGWWTKYNGWLPIAVTIAALALAWVLEVARPRAQAVGEQPAVRSEPSGWSLGLRRALLVLTAALVGWLLWLPFLSSLQSEGGYSVVAANHRQYVVGPTGWFSSAVRQFGNLRALEGGSTICGLLLGVGLAVWRKRDSRLHWLQRQGPRVLSVIVVSLLMSLLIGPTLGMAICGIVGAAVVFPFRVRNFDQRFGACLVAVLAVGLAVSIPLYRPYPRLLLPWLPGVWWCLSWWCGRILDATESGGGGRLVARPPMWAAALIVVALLAGCVWRHPNHPWRTRLALRDVAHQINQIARQSPNRSLRVFGEPAMFFHLCETGSPHQTTPIQTLTFAKQPHRPFAPDIFLVAGPHARRSPQFQESWPDVAARLELIGEFDYFATDFVALNHHPRGEVRAGRGPNEPIRLYRLR